MNAFQYTNAMRTNRLFAIYAQNTNRTKLIDFNGLMAGVQLSVYLLIIAFSCVLVVLFAIIEHVRPAHNQAHFKFWHILIAVFPSTKLHVLKAPQKYRFFVFSAFFVNNQSTA